MNESRRMLMLFSFSALFDLRLVDLLQALVVDDLDPLPLLHVVDDQLADDAVRERVVLDPDGQVIEEVGRPQPLEVFANDLLGRLVVGHPPVRRADWPAQLDVVEVGVRLDDREATLLFEAGDDLVHHGSRSVGRHACGGSGRAGRRRSGPVPPAGAWAAVAGRLDRRRGRRGRRRGLSVHGHGGRQRSEEKQQHTHSRTFVKSRNVRQ